MAPYDSIGSASSGVSDRSKQFPDIAERHPVSRERVSLPRNQFARDPQALSSGVPCSAPRDVIPSSN